MENELIELAEQLGRLLKIKRLKIATAESCTGGWIAQVITEIPGSSAWFDRGFVTYSNASKIEMLGVARQTLEQFGAVSSETVQAMAKGALQNSDADLAIAVTGIAGPDGGTVEKPVGTVFIAFSGKGMPDKSALLRLTGTRREVRVKTVELVLKGIVDYLIEIF